MKESDLHDHIHNLRNFMFAIDAGSIAGAAKKLFRAPSAVTRSILELERAAGVQLCERTAQGLVMNRQGRFAYARAARIAEELHQAAGELARVRNRASAASSSALTDLLFSGRKLRLVDRVCELGTVSSAAAQLEMTQSGASMALARIENSLGLNLFVRGRHSMVATEEARRLVLHARRVFAELRHLSAELTGDDNALRGEVVIGTSPLSRTHILPAAIATALSCNPSIRVTLVENVYDQLVSGLRAGDIDAIVGVARSRDEETGLSVEPLLSDRLAIIAGASHAFVGAEPSTADLQSARWILPWPQSPSRTLFDAAFRTLGFAPPLASVESADLAVIRQLLVSTDMLALVSARQMMFELETSLVAELSSPLPSFARNVGLITRQGAMLPSAGLAILDAIRSQVASSTSQDDEP